MKCLKVRNALSAYLDDELFAGEAEDVRAHLSACPHCSRELFDLRQGVSLVSSLSELPVPANFRADLMVKVRAQVVAPATDSAARALLLGRPVPRWVALLRSPAAVAAAVVVVAGLTAFAAGRLPSARTNLGQPQSTDLKVTYQPPGDAVQQPVDPGNSPLVAPAGPKAEKPSAGVTAKAPAPMPGQGSTANPASSANSASANEVTPPVENSPPTGTAANLGAGAVEQPVASPPPVSPDRFTAASASPPGVPTVPAVARGATVVVTVQDVPAAVRQVETVSERYKGKLGTVDVEVKGSVVSGALLVVKVPVQLEWDVVNAVTKLGNVLEGTGIDDVDLSADYAGLQAQVSQARERLRNPPLGADVAALQNELKLMEGKLAQLDQTLNTATVKVSLRAAAR